MLKKSQALEKLQRQLNLIQDIKAEPHDSSDFKKWQRDTQIAIENIFGTGTRHIKDFEDVRYSFQMFTSATPESAFDKKFQQGLDDAAAIIESLIDEVKEYWPEDEIPSRSNAIDLVEHSESKPPQNVSNIDPSTLPQEIYSSYRNFQKDHPNPAQVAFIMMKFSNTQAHQAIANAIKSALSQRGIEGLRADDKQYHDDLFPNILTYLNGCGFGIAVFERIESEEFNPNVSFEVGYMFGLRRPVCLLKDRTLKTLHTDLVGKLYRLFDPQNITETIGDELTRWLRDKNLGK